ncbi:MAG: potassium channel protein [Rubricoccaceae bacterium]|nr:potassium channel protein [Rubricoccaceae bacterium]
MREILLGSIALFCLLASGSIGYWLIEGWTLMDALYMTFITLTTIGFAEVAPLSNEGKMFTMALASVGIGTFAYIASRTVQSIVTNQLWRSRLMKRKIDRLSGHFIVCGYGRLGQRVVRDLTAAGKNVVVIDRQDAKALQLEEAGIPFIQDEAEEESTLREAGIEGAAGLILVLPSDAANVFVALTAREMRPGPDLFIVARTNEQTAISKLVRAGVDKVVSPLEIGGDRIAQTILRPHVDRFMEKVLGIEVLDFNLEELRVLPGSLIAGKSLAEIEFKKRFNAIVVGLLKHGETTWRYNPDASLPVDAGDTMIVLGPMDMIEKIRTEGCAPL